MAEPTGSLLRIRLEGRDELNAKLTEAKHSLDNATPLFDRIGSILVDSTHERMIREVDPQGNPWPKSIRALAEGGRTLYDSGQFFGSITHLATADSVEVGTNHIGARVHQEGAVIRPVNAPRLAFQVGGQTVFAQQVTIPRRAYLGLDDGDEAEILEVIGEYLVTPLNSGGVSAH